jgi:hypothetical protein
MKAALAIMTAPGMPKEVGSFLQNSIVYLNANPPGFR